MTVLPRLHLVRHGETDWSRTGRHTGHTDVPLTDQGEHDARALASSLARIPLSHVFTSPRLRAQRTGALAGLGDAPAVVVEALLAEWDYGDFEGMRTADIQAVRARWNLYRDGSPGGESPQLVEERADRLLHRLRELAGDITLFTHGHFGSVLAARWIGLPIRQAEHFALAPASLSILGSRNGYPGVGAIEAWNMVPARVRETLESDPEQAVDDCP